MYYPEELVEEIRSKNDIVDVISSYVRLQKKGSSYFGLCPFHNEKSPSFSVSRQKQMYYCFGCGAGGNVFTFLMEYETLFFCRGTEISGGSCRCGASGDRSTPGRRKSAQIQKLYYWRLIRQQHSTFMYSF